MDRIVHHIQFLVLNMVHMLQYVLGLQPSHHNGCTITLEHLFSPCLIGCLPQVIHTRIRMLVSMGLSAHFQGLFGPVEPATPF